ncbi:Trehalase [Ceratocystis platani]|uniref:Trehalase n=1 Tax=Ceratocystis fimbriata f. sp. platani TaxID=88771 RepID=A0A0F8D853_CERFI|nr:Trehalase [Ceratocystis platani]
MYFLRASLALAAAASRTYATYDNGAVVAPCDSPIYCYGDMLKQIQLARPFDDSKTFVDMPALKPLSKIQAAFDELPKPVSNNLALQDFLRENFGPVGSELQALDKSTLETNAVFLDKIQDSVLREFTQKVMEIWPDLTRQYVGDAMCERCPNSFIPIKKPFVISGGRFREPHYWDTLWIIVGLLRTGGSYVDLARNAIENFMDLIDVYGFVPKGSRVYYLNRSQPPLLALMVKAYFEHTKDSIFLEQAIPLLEKEYNYWMDHRSLPIEKDGKRFVLNRYDVKNTQPCPESYLENYITANNASYYSKSGAIYPGIPLGSLEVANLYSNLASGAESGWDYSSRWMANPSDAIEDKSFPLRSLNTKNIIPVDLNSIMYGLEDTMAGFMLVTKNSTGFRIWHQRSVQRSQAMYKLLWNSDLYSYFDYNITSNSQVVFVPVDEDDANENNDGADWAPEGMKVLRSVSSYYPFWMNAAPTYIHWNAESISKAFLPVMHQIDRYTGAIPATNVRSGQQWDAPNVWPPHIHIIISALKGVPALGRWSDPDWERLHHLALRVAQRYIDSVFCTWRSTGGSTSELPKLSGLPDNSNGVIFEKYSSQSISSPGSGGEYDVAEGFGWTNGVLLYIMDEFGAEIQRPECGNE